MVWVEWGDKLYLHSLIPLFNAKLILIVSCLTKRTYPASTFLAPTGNSEYDKRELGRAARFGRSLEWRGRGKL